MRYTQIVEAMRRPRKPPPSPLYHVTSIENEASIRTNGIEPRAGRWVVGDRIHRWGSSVFFVTSLNAAYEMEMMFAGERDRGRDFIFVLVDPSRVPNAVFRKDRESDGVLTTSHIPREAIIRIDYPDEDYRESPDFRRYMGDET